MMRQSKYILAVDMRYDVISENQRISFEHNYPDKQIFLYGRNISGDDEVVISEDFLSELGFTREEMERLTGNRVSLKRTDNGEIYLDGFTVCGIASSEAAASVFGQNSMMITKSAAEKQNSATAMPQYICIMTAFRKRLKRVSKPKKRYSRNCRTQSYDIFKNRQSKCLYRKDSDCYTAAYMCFNAAVGGIRTFAVLFGHRTENSCDESARSHKNGCVRNNSCGNGSCCFVSGVAGFLLSVGVNAVYNIWLESYFDLSVQIISTVQLIAGAVSCMFMFACVLTASFVTTIKISSASIDRMLKGEH